MLLLGVGRILTTKSSGLSIDTEEGEALIKHSEVVKSCS